MTDIIDIFDCPGSRAGSLPAGAQAAGYTTGAAGVEWSTADFAAHPRALRVDQSPLASAWDALADVQDFERGAVTLSELPGRMRASIAAYHAGARPGQRWPTVYVGARSNATPAVNALIAAGITYGVYLAVASPGITPAEADQMITSTIGTPWPIVWVQYDFGPNYDSGRVSVPWLSSVSVAERKLVSVTLDFDSGSPMVFRV